MTESKKAWVEPELIVLVRSKPEEAVLGTCKGGSSEGPVVSYDVCWIVDEFCAAPCVIRGGS
jgi:hypothetical protein